MARHAQDREDLLRDATAFTHRIEFRTTDSKFSGTVFVGFRTNGAVSLYFDQDPVYHFNSQRQIRRAYYQGRFIKSEQGRLVALDTTRTETAVEMHRHEMTADECQQFCSLLMERFDVLIKQIQQNQIEILGTVPKGDAVIEQLQTWLCDFTDIQIAETPRVA